MKFLAYLLPLLLLCGGCATGSPGDSLQAWILREATHGPYPRTLTRCESLGQGHTHAFTLALDAPARASLDCGQGLVLKVLGPGYTDGRAWLILADADGDGILDLHFSARLLPEDQPYTAFFLYRPDAWERYLLPGAQIAPAAPFAAAAPSPSKEP